MAVSWPTLRKPCAAMIPNSARCARNAFTSIVLIALDVRLHVLRRHQPHLVPKRTQLARPVMGRRTRFQPDHTAWNAAEERQHLTAPQSLTQNRRTLRINAVNLKNMLG